MRPLILLLALWWARSANGKGIVVMYVDAQILFTVAVYGSLLFMPETSVAYAWVFSLATLPILIACLLIAHRGYRTHNVKRLALLTSLGFTATLLALYAHGLAHPMRYQDWIAVSEGAILAASGVMTGISAPFAPRPTISMILGVLWLVQASYEFGFSIHMPSPAWDDWNEKVPFLLVVLAMVIIGYERRRLTGTLAGRCKPSRP